MAPATTASSGSHDHGDWRNYDCAWRDIGTAYAVEVTMPARAAPAGHGDSQLRSRLIKGRCRHCLSGRNTKKADSDEQTERKYSGHAFLLWFWVVPPTFRSNHYPFHYGTPITTTNKLSRFHKADKRNGLALVSRLANDSAASDCDISGSAVLRRHCLDLLGGLAGECSGWL